KIERADHTYQGILKPAGRERERVEADLDVGVDPDHQLVVALPQRSVQGGRLAGVGDGRHLSGCRGQRVDGGLCNRLRRVVGAVVADDDVNAAAIATSRLVDGTDVPGKQPLLV